LQNSFRERCDDGRDYPVGKGREREREREREGGKRTEGKRDKNQPIARPSRVVAKRTQRIGRSMKIASREAHKEKISRNSLLKLLPLLSFAVVVAKYNRG